MIGMRKTEWAETLTEGESRTQMGIWSVEAAPLLMSNDLRVIPGWAREILLNKEVIAVDQDKLGKQGRRLTEYNDNSSIWVRELDHGEYAIVLWNRGDDGPRDITVKFSAFTSYNQLKLRDLWQRKDIGVYVAEYTAKSIPPHDSVMLRAIPQ
jgi:hypothetical protein